MPTVSMADGSRRPRVRQDAGIAPAQLDGTLACVIQGLGVRSVEDAVLPWLIEIVLQACDCVARSHARGAIHGALTPSCVMIGRSGAVSVVQSGLSTDPASIAYYATEQAWGRSADLDARTDVYAFGGMLFAILTLRAPHDCRGDAALELASARRGVVSDPQALCTERTLPRDLCRIAMRALSASPADRYPSIELLRADLERFLRSCDAVPVVSQAPAKPAHSLEGARPIVYCAPIGATAQ